MGHHKEVAKDRLSHRIIGVAIEVHSHLGPDLREHLYRDAFCLGLEDRGLKVEREYEVSVQYLGTNFGSRFIDLLVEGDVVVELKAVSRLNDAHFQQLGTNVRLLQKRRGLLINFGGPRAHIRRYANSAQPSLMDVEGEREW